MNQYVAGQKTNLPPIYELGDDFYDIVEPVKFPHPKLQYKNPSLALENIKGFTWDHLCHFKALENNIKAPLALRYHGHQFRHYNPDLGDGRGFLYAQIFNGQHWYDLGTKGSGTTPYSRSGDGRLTLKGAVREALATEMLESYGVDTSKTACFFETGEKLIRYDEPSPTRSAVLTRFSRGHIRIGTFQRLAYYKQISQIKKLTQYCLKLYYTQESQTIDWDNDQETSTRFFQCVSEKLAQQAAQLMVSGFVHGVLNSDNINISGELFDYGPYRFLPHYDPHFTAAYFDQNGLYAFGRQPESIFWNLARLGESLLLAYPDLPLQIMLENFEDLFNDNLYDYFQKKLNVKFKTDDQTTQALQLFFTMASKTRLLFEKLFFSLHSANIQKENNEIIQFKEFKELRSLIEGSDVLNQQIHHNSYFQRDEPETLIINEIENIWNEIDQNNDWSLFHQKIESIRAMRGCYNYSSL